ncbi:MAG: hypothetical protein KAI03_06680 [Candidatus Aureabacteria bacterium]|nr:hypothetical protein [Candidatus Auribacterota bacterium]
MKVKQEAFYLSEELLTRQNKNVGQKRALFGTSPLIPINSGSIYGSDDYRNKLVASGLVPSMSRKGDSKKMYVVTKFPRVVLWTLLILCFFTSQTPYAMAQETEDETVIKLALVLCPELGEFISSDNWFDNLSNPVLMTEEEIRERQQSYEKIFVCLSYIESELTLPNILKAVKTLFEYFIIFAGTYEDTTFKITEGKGILNLLRAKRELVNLETTTDPAIVKLREKVGLPVPKGFVYIRYYPGKELMPKAVQPAFKSENTKAVTLLSRYVAVLSEPEVSVAKKQLKKRMLPKTVSHELVHVYINSNMSLLDRSKLPLWFHEGCAIYFSGSGGTESATEVSPTIGGYVYITYTVRDPKEYKEYKIVFNYLESKIGQESLYGFIKHAIEAGTIDQILASVGVPSFEDLLNDAKDWHSTRKNIKWGIILLILIIIIYLFWRMLPIEEKPPSV